MKVKQLPHVSKSQWLVASVGVFLVGVLFLSARDWIIHHDLYNWGLQGNMAWIAQDWAIYFVELEVLAVACVLIARSHRLSLFIIFEAFILSSTQDLLFFGVWGHGEFPVGNWVWMPIYQVLGVWTSTMQFALSGFALLAGGLIAYFLPRKIHGVNVP